MYSFCYLMTYDNVVILYTNKECECNLWEVRLYILGRALFVACAAPVYYLNSLLSYKVLFFCCDWQNFTLFKVYGKVNTKAFVFKVV